MKILSVAHSLPSRLVTNDALTARIVAESRPRMQAVQLAMLEPALAALFERVGAAERYHRGANETALDIGLQAGRRALEQAGLEPRDIGLLIYVGVGRGFVEPATANLFQDSLRLRNATCFDILDACASWLRGLDVAYNLLLTGAYDHAMVLNCELNFDEYATLGLESLDELAQVGAGYTIGEAATATIITRGERDRRYHTTFKTRGDQHSLCEIPLPHAAQFRAGAERPALRFHADAQRLNGRAIAQLEEQYWSDERLCKRQHDIVFGHSASVPTTVKVMDKLRLDLESHYEIFPRYGNTVSASLPLAMSLAADAGRLQRGQSVLLVMGSAGLTTAFSAFDF